MRCEVGWLPAPYLQTTNFNWIKVLLETWLSFIIVTFAGGGSQTKTEQEGPQDTLREAWNPGTEAPAQRPDRLAANSVFAVMTYKAPEVLHAHYLPSLSNDLWVLSSAPTTPI